MIKVIFVCLGNICRSPMAEAVFRHKVKEAGLENKIVVDSAGTGEWHIGERPHEATHNLLIEFGINADGLISRQIKKEDIEEFTYVVAMDEQNRTDIKEIGGSEQNKEIIRLMDLVEDEQTKNIPDPYYTGNFYEVYELINAGTDKLLSLIKEEQQL